MEKRVENLYFIKSKKYELFLNNLSGSFDQRVEATLHSIIESSECTEYLRRGTELSFDFFLISLLMIGNEIVSDGDVNPIDKVI